MDEKNANWQHWFDRHGAALILFARQRTSCYADAEDLVQSAFVRFWKHRQSAKDPLTYLYSCVTSAAYDQHRSDARRREREKNAWFVRAENETLVEPFEIEGALTALPDEQREVLILKI